MSSTKAGLQRQQREESSQVRLWWEIPMEIKVARRSAARTVWPAACVARPFPARSFLVDAIKLQPYASNDVIAVIFWLAVSFPIGRDAGKKQENFCVTCLKFIEFYLGAVFFLFFFFCSVRIQIDAACCDATRTTYTLTIARSHRTCFKSWEK